MITEPTSPGILCERSNKLVNFTSSDIFHKIFLWSTNTMREFKEQSERKGSRYTYIYIRVTYTRVF